MPARWALPCRRRCCEPQVGLAAPAWAAAERIPLYTGYTDPPLDAQSPGNLTAQLAAWLSERSAGRYLFVPTQLPRPELNRLVEQATWPGVVAWANPVWFRDTEEKRFLWTRALMQDADLLVSRRASPVEYLNEGHSLEGLRVGAVVGRRLAELEWLIEKGRVQRIDAARQIDNLLALKAGQVDVVMVQAISLPHFRRLLPDLDNWLHVSKQPRQTYARRLFTAANQRGLQQFLDQQVELLTQDPVWQARLPKAPRQLRLLAIDRLDSPYFVALRTMLDVLFERAGLSYSLTAVPIERAFVELEQGRFDGDISRHSAFQEQLPGAIRVDPAHSRALHLALTKPGGPRVQSWQDLQSVQFAIARGFKLLEVRSSHLPGRVLATGPEACIRMVEADRVQACLTPSYTATERPGRELGINLEAQVFDQAPIHLWLRAGLQDEARRLSTAMTALQREGVLDRLLAPYRSGLV